MRNTNFILNVYEKKKLNSKLSTQILFGENFIILKKYKNWFKIKCSYDNYVGFIKKNRFKKNIIPTHKVNKLYAKIYKKPYKKYEMKNKLSFCSKIKVIEEKNNFYKFDKYWINKNDVDPHSVKKNAFSKIKIFKNVKYKWGGLSYKGIDCSALIQIFYKYNNNFCPRDTKYQIKFFKIKKNIKNFNKNDLIFWKGHVALGLSKKKLIHAYGPEKKVVIMDVKKTINKIKTSAKLKVIGIRAI
jgi:hypothetical protein